MPGRKEARENEIQKQRETSVETNIQTEGEIGGRGHGVIQGGVSASGLSMLQLCAYSAVIWPKELCVFASRGRK